MSNASRTVSQSEILGPLVRWFNPFRLKVRLRHDGWAATYRLPNGSSGVTGCETRREAIQYVRRSVRVRVADIDGKFVEVDKTGSPVRKV